MPELPYDVWLLITQYIPRSALLRLYSINRALLDIVRDERYRESRIYHLEDEPTKMLLNALSIPNENVACRIRKLCLRPHSLGPPFAYDSGSSWKTWILPESRTKRRFMMKQKKAAEKLLQSLSQFSSLTTLNLECPFIDDYPAFKLTSPFLNEAWKTYAHTLQVLNLQIPLEAYRDMILPSQRLECLRDLTIHVFARYLTTEPGELMKTNLATFVNNHQPSLESLRVTSFDLNYGYDESVLFARLVSFPKLSELELSLHISSDSHTDFGGLEQFLFNHAGQLTTLQIQCWHLLGSNYLPYPMDNLLTRPFFTIFLPQLRSLTFGLTNERPGAPRKPRIENFLAYLSQYRETLVTLTLPDNILSYEEVKMVVSLFKSGHLRSLNIYAKFLGPDLLNLMSAQLPELDRLCLTFDSWIGEHDHGFLTVSFNEQISRRVDNFISTTRPGAYAQWNLRHLAVHVKYKSNGKLALCYEALMKALPSLQTFNGMAPADVLRVPNYMKDD